MNTIIDKINAGARKVHLNEQTFSELYDQYAPSLYGTIIRVVQQKEIADKILETVFINAMQKTIAQPEHVRPFAALINHTRRKSEVTLKALRILQACNCA